MIYSFYSFLQTFKGINQKNTVISVSIFFLPSILHLPFPSILTIGCPKVNISNLLIRQSSRIFGQVIFVSQGLEQRECSSYMHFFQYSGESFIKGTVSGPTVPFHTIPNPTVLKNRLNQTVYRS